MATRFILLGLCCLCPSFVLLNAQEKTGPTPEQAWQRLKDGNARFAADRPERPDLGAQKRRLLAGGQRPFAVVLTCADSRVPPELVFNQGLGDLFVLRVAGNLSEPFVVGSIEYAVEHLHVPLIVVLGHEKCGAVEAALGKNRPAGDLGKLLDAVHVGKGLPEDAKKALPAAIQNNVRRQAELLTQRSDIIRRHVQQKELRIVSGVYLLASGRIVWLTEP